MRKFEKVKEFRFLALSLACLLFLAVIPSLTTTDTMIRIKSVEAQAPDDFRFTTVGDWGCKTSTNSMISLMASKNPEVVLGLGDYSYKTKMTCWHDILTNFPTIHDKIHLYNSLAFGNHEDDDCSGCGSGTNLDSEGEVEYLAHFGQPPTFFSFDHKRVHFLSIDSQSVPYDQNSEQYIFVNNDLIQTKQRVDNGTADWIVVFMHHPMYTSCIADCSHHGNMTGIREVYQPLFDSYGVDLVLQGHIHAYERMKPMKYNSVITHPDTFDYVNPAGQVYITVGTGGQSLYKYTSKPEMSVTQIEAFGFLALDVTRTSLVGRFIDINDTVQDIFVILKSDESLPSPPGLAPPPTEPDDHGPSPPEYYFNGSNYTQISSTSSLRLSQFSVATWFKLDADYKTLSQKRLIVNKGGFGSESAGKNMNYGIWVDFGSTHGNKIEAGFETSSGPDFFVRSPGTYNDGNWHYAVVTFDGTVLRLYVDGVQVSTLSTTAKPDNTGSQPLRIGMNSLTLDRGYIGYADEVRVWNRAITAQEVSDQFNLTIFDATGQVAYFSP